METAQPIADQRTKTEKNGMLMAYPTRGRANATHTLHEVLWVDLLDPTNDETAGVESKFSLRLPSREELSEIESSSRISEEDGVLFLSMPSFAHAQTLDEASSPIDLSCRKAYWSLFDTRNCAPSTRWRRSFPRAMHPHPASKLSPQSSMRS